jgi:hypothetical protein
MKKLTFSATAGLIYVFFSAVPVMARCYVMAGHTPPRGAECQQVGWSQMGQAVYSCCDKVNDDSGIGTSRANPGRRYFD